MLVTLPVSEVVTSVLLEGMVVELMVTPSRLVTVDPEAIEVEPIVGAE